jgi:hypothetical protein
VLAVLGLGLGACDPYEDFGDESLSLGAVDPLNFPPANLGAGGNRTRPGNGSFEEIPAWVGGTPVGYFRYALPATTMVMGGMPVVPASVSRVYAFDATPAQPVPDKNDCTPPPGWKPDPRLDDVNYEQQGNIFTALPTATYNPGVAAASTYIPVVAQAPVQSGGQVCQRIKSSKGLEKALGMLPGPGNDQLAWLIIDPAAGVYPFDADETHNGLGLQKWGWYNRYLLAYLDGGYLPVMQMDTVRLMRPQRLYLPRSPVMGAMGPVQAQVGQGLDVLTARRGQDGYSPLCEVMTYDLGMAVPPDMLPRDAAAITGDPAIAMTLEPAASRFVFCLQVLK